MLKQAIKNRIDQSVYNLHTSVAAEVRDNPSRMTDGSYHVPVELIGGSYGGITTFVAVYTDNISGVSGNSLKKGDLVMLSFDEKGYSAPRITSIISRETAYRNAQIRSRPSVSDDARLEATRMLQAGSSGS